MDLLPRIPADRQVINAYGDGGFRGHHWCLRTAHVGTPQEPLTTEEIIQNYVMKKGRVSIEHSYGKVATLWRLEQTGKRLFQIEWGLAHVDCQICLMYLLTNIHTCYQGSVVSLQFNMIPPTAMEYLGNSTAQ